MGSQAGLAQAGGGLQRAPGRATGQGEHLRARAADRPPSSPMEPAAVLACLIRKRAGGSLPHARMALAQSRQAEVLALNCGGDQVAGRHEAGAWAVLGWLSAFGQLWWVQRRRWLAPWTPPRPHPPVRGGAEKIFSRQRLSHSSWYLTYRSASGAAAWRGEGANNGQAANR